MVNILQILIVLSSIAIMYIQIFIYSDSESLYVKETCIPYDYMSHTQTHVYTLLFSELYFVTYNWEYNKVVVSNPFCFYSCNVALFKFVNRSLQNRKQ